MRRSLYHQNQCSPSKILHPYKYLNLLNDKITYLQVKKRDCIWSWVDYSEELPIKRKFMAKFSSEEAATEFKHTFEEVCDGLSLTNIVHI